jgi:GT2 family glycosyltransferase
MFCRAAPLQEAMPMVFDESFFMYKEDIDLCLRLRKKGWKLLYDPEVEAYHARGWTGDRKKIAHEIRCLASRNEIRLNLKHHSPYVIWALGKYLAVRLFKV